MKFPFIRNTKARLKEKLESIRDEAIKEIQKIKELPDDQVGHIDINDCILKIRQDFDEIIDNL